MNCAECRHCLAKNGATMYNSGNSNKGEKTTMQNEDMQMIPYYVHESDMARMEKDKERLERINKRLFATLILCIIIIAGMFIYEAQFVDEVWTSEATTDGGGTAVANMDGEVYYYGESESNPPQENPQDGK